MWAGTLPLYGQQWLGGLLPANVQIPIAIDPTATFKVFTPDRSGVEFKLGKQPRERFVGVGMDFKTLLATNEQIVDGQIESSIAGVGTFLRHQGTSLYAIIQGGADGQIARVTYVGYGNKGSVVEGELVVTIKSY